MAHDVFISYSSKDQVAADAVCAALEQAGVSCWIAPRDIKPGAEWPTAIMEGITDSRTLLLILNGNANASRWVRYEVQQACDQGLAILPFRIENVLPTGGLKFVLGPVQWLDALPPPIERHYARLVEKIKALPPSPMHRCLPLHCSNLRLVHRAGIGW